MFIWVDGRLYKDEGRFSRKGPNQRLPTPALQEELYADGVSGHRGVQRQPNGEEQVAHRRDVASVSNHVTSG